MANFRELLAATKAEIREIDTADAAELDGSSGSRWPGGLLVSCPDGHVP